MSIIKIFLIQMAHNVPAVYDVLPARIRACVARPGLAKCGWNEPWERSDLGEWNPGAAEGGGAYTDLLGAVIFAFTLSFLYSFFLFAFLCYIFFFIGV
jgi:hypothetical protein